jgi:hypothetical protein
METIAEPVAQNATWNLSESADVLRKVAARLSESGHRDTCGNCMDEPEFAYECLLVAMTEDEYAIELAATFSEPAGIECHPYCDNSACLEYGWAWGNFLVRSDSLKAVLETWAHVVHEYAICAECGQVGGLRVSPDEPLLRRMRSNHTP